MKELWDLIRGQREVRKAQPISLPPRQPSEIAIQNELDIQNQAYTIVYDLFDATFQNAPEVLAAPTKRISERRQPLTLEDIGFSCASDAPSGVYWALDDSIDRRLLIDWGNKVELTPEEEELGQRILAGNADPDERLLVKDCSSIIAFFRNSSVYFSTTREGYRSELRRPTGYGRARHYDRIPTVANYRTVDGSEAVARFDYETILNDPTVIASVIEQKLEDPIKSLIHLPTSRRWC